MKYLDANLFIYAALSPKTEQAGILARKILTRVFEGKLAAATSSLTWDEVVWVIRKIEGEKVAASEGAKFLSFPKLVILSVSESVIFKAQELVENIRIKPRDAIHAACCIENGIEEIVTNDPDFDLVEGVKKVSLNAV